MEKPGHTSRRWRDLMGLTAVVLVVHVWLLGGQWWNEPKSDRAVDEQPPAGFAAPQPKAPLMAAGEAPARAQPVTLIGVRWTEPSPSSRAPALAPPEVSAPSAAITGPPQAAAAQPVAVPAAPAPRVASPEPKFAAPSPAPVVTASDAAEPLADNSDATRAPTPAPDVLLVAAAPESAPTASTAPGPSAARPNLPPAQAPGPTELAYEVTGRTKGLRYSADARLRWQPSGNRYSAELEVSAFLVGSRVQTSRGRLDAQGLSPERFGDKRRGNEKATHFDQAGQRIRYSSNAPDTPLLPGAQDRLSVFVQLAALFQARPQAYAAGQTIRLQVAGTGDADTWVFQVGPQETLALPAGNLQARRLTRGPRNEHDNTLDIWLAPDLQHLPVRIRITEPSGDLADQRLRQRPS